MGNFPVHLPLFLLASGSLVGVWPSLDSEVFLGLSLSNHWFCENLQGAL